MSYSIDLRGETVFTASLNMGSQKIINVANGVSTTDAVNVSQLLAAVPTGMCLPFAGANTSPSLPPSTGWLICNGAAVSRSTYANLFTAIGTTYGSGDGSTTFNVPNLAGRVVVSTDNSSLLIGASGGANTVTLTTANLAAHNHGVSDPGHNHSHSDPGHTHGAVTGNHTHGVSDPGHAHGSNLMSFIGSGGSLGIGASPFNVSSGNSAGAFTGISINAVGNIGVSVSAAATGISNVAAATGITTQNAGSGTAHNNMQPYVVMTYYIKT